MPTTSGTRKTVKKSCDTTSTTPSSEKTTRTRTRTKSDTPVSTEELIITTTTETGTTTETWKDEPVSETISETRSSSIPTLTDITAKIAGFNLSSAIPKHVTTPALLSDGNFDISRKVLARIAELAAREIEGLVPPRQNPLNRLVDSIKGRTNGIRVDIGTTEAAVAMEVRVTYGTQIPEAAILLREIVAKRINEMTGLNVVEFNVRVQDITPARPTSS